MNRPCLESPIKRQYLKKVLPFCFHQFASDRREPLISDLVCSHRAIRNNSQLFMLN